MPSPPYNVGVTLKLKLQDAGFQVVFDPKQPHDAILHIQYEEIPSRQFQVLEQATAIRYNMQLVHDRLGEIFSHHFEAQPNEIPLGSLYWDAIGNLEEDPYYCFVGDLIRGHIDHDQNEQETLLSASGHARIGAVVVQHAIAGTVDVSPRRYPHFAGETNVPVGPGDKGTLRHVFFALWHG